MAIYQFRGKASHDGNPGEIPEIWLEKKDELPPIEEAAILELPHLHRSELMTSELRIIWEVNGEQKIIINTKCEVGDKRLNLQHDGHFLERFTDWLVDSTVRFSSVPFLLRKRIPESIIPSSITPYIEQVKAWAEFIRPLQEKLVLNMAHHSQVVDGYYCLVPHRHALRLPPEFMENWEVISDVVFNFSPGTQRPIVEKDCVWWVMEERKIKVIFPHSTATKKMAVYYGYEAVYNNFIEEQEKKKKLEKDEQEALSRDRQREKEEKKKELRKFLLG